MPFASFHVRCLLSNYAILVRRQVCVVPLQCPVDYMSIWYPKRVADPFSSSFSYLGLLYWLLPCLSPNLFIADFSRPPNPQDVLQVLIDEHLQLLLQSLFVSPQVSEPYESAAITFDPRLSAWSWLLLLWIATLVPAFQMPVLPFQFVPECPLQCLPSCLQCSQGM